MTILIATSVVRGSRQGESHGGIYLVDLDHQRVAQAVDWNTTNIDWQGRGWDRGLRGIAFDGGKVLIAEALIEDCDALTEPIRLDLAMLTYFGAGERTLDDYAMLAADAGLEVMNTVAVTPALSVIEACPRS